MTQSQSLKQGPLSTSSAKCTLLVEIAAVAIIAAIAIFLRFYQIEQVPPGFNSDEAVGAVGAVETLRSGLKLYYAGQGGGGALGFYIAAIAFALFGPGVATIRGTAAFAGVVSVVVTYLATREMFRILPASGQAPFAPGQPGSQESLNRARLLAALAALALATSLWHTQSSRVAFAAIGVPFLQVPGNYFLWRGLNTGRRVYFVVSGVFLALLAYIYMSGSFAPFVYLSFFLMQWAIAAIPSPNRWPPLLRQHFRNLVICAAVALVLFLPMLYFYFSSPELATGRAQQAMFTNPLINKGDPWGTLWHSLWGNLASFGISTSWFLGRPPANLMLPVPVSLLFLLGFAVSLWRVRRPPYLFILLYWGIMIVPSILSPDSIPHPLRALGASPAAYTLVAVGVVALVDGAKRLAALIWARGSHQLPLPRRAVHGLTVALLLALTLVIVPPLYAGFHNYMTVWPKTNDAQAAFHVYAVDLAAEMSKETNPQASFLLPRHTAAGDVNPNYTVMFFYTGQAGYAWVVDDEATLEETLKDAVSGRDVVHVIRWKTSKHTGADPKEIMRYYLEKHGHFADIRLFKYYNIETFQLDRVGPDLTDPPLAPVSSDFGGAITLTGYAFGGASSSGPVEAASVPAGELVWSRLRFRLEDAVQEDLKASVIIADSAGHVVGQIDKLLMNNIYHQGSTQWEPGTEVDAYFLVPVAHATAPGPYHLDVAVYGASSQVRLPLPSGEPSRAVALGTLVVRPDPVPPSNDALAMSQAVNRPAADGLTLLGYTAPEDPLRPGQQASLALLWRADAAPADDYRASLWAMRDGDAWPLTGELPLAGLEYATSQWTAGQVVRGWFDGRVPPDVASGAYQMEVRVVDSLDRSTASIPLGPLTVQGWPRQFEVPPMQAVVEANFADQMELLGLDVAAPAADTADLTITLYWRALSEMETDFTTFVHLLDESGQVVAQVDHVPGDGSFPTTGWLPGEVVADRFAVPWSAEMRTSAHQVEIGAYDPRTLERLPVLDQGGAPIDTRVLLPAALHPGEIEQP